MEERVIFMSNMIRWEGTEMSCRTGYDCDRGVAEKMGEGRIKAKDVAKALGISQTTVSRALSGKGRVNLDTAERVRKYVEEHGGIDTGAVRTKNIALILPEEYSTTYPTFFFECLAGVQRMCNQKGYDVIVTSIAKNRVAPLERIVKARKIDGAILARTYENDETIRYLNKHHISMVAIGYTDENDIVCVDHDNQKSSSEITQLLVDRGCQRLLFVDGKSEHLVNNYRRLGFEAACDRNKKRLSHFEIADNIVNQRDVQVAVRGALRQKIDGMICADDYLAVLVMNELKRRNVQVPEEMKVVSLFDNVYLELNSPSVTSVRFNNIVIGEEAALELIRQIENPGCPMVKLKILSYEIRMRETTE